MRLNIPNDTLSTNEVSLSELEVNNIRISAIKLAIEDVACERDSLDGLIHTLRECKEELQEQKTKLLEDRLALLSLGSCN